jgi:hypothetical protein
VSRTYTGNKRRSHFFCEALGASFARSQSAAYTAGSFASLQPRVVYFAGRGGREEGKVVVVGVPARPLHETVSGIIGDREPTMRSSRGDTRTEVLIYTLDLPDHPPLQRTGELTFAAARLPSPSLHP